MTTITGFILWLVFILVTGRSVMAILMAGKKLFYTAEKAALSYIIGVGMVSLEMMVLQVSGIPFTIISLSLSSVPFILLAVFFSRRDISVLQTTDIDRNVSVFTPLEKFLIAAITLEIVYAFFRALIKPIESYDSIAFYAFKAKIFYLAGGIPKNFITDFKDIVPHVDYPLLLPLTETSLYTFIGSLNDQVVKVIFPLFYLSVITIFYSVARRMLSRKTSLVFTFMLASIPQLRDHATIGYADLPLAVFFSASFFYLFLWMRQKKSGFLMLSFLCGMLSAWTKTEGLVLFAVNAAALIVCVLLDSKKNRSRAVAMYTLALIFFVGVVLVTKRFLGLPFHGDFVTTSSIKSACFAERISWLPRIFYEYQRQFFGPKKWNIIWVIFIVLAAFNIRAIARKDTMLPTIVIAFCFFSYTAIYLITPLDVNFHVNKTIGRLLLHFVPIIVLWIALIYKRWYGSEST